MVQESVVVEPSLVRMSVQPSAFTSPVSQHKLFCGSVKGLVNSLPAQSLEFLQVVPHKGYCARFILRGVQLRPTIEGEWAILHSEPS